MNTEVSTTTNASTTNASTNNASTKNALTGDSSTYVVKSPWGKRIALTAWLMLPVAAVAFHLAYGDALLARDRAEMQRKLATDYAADERHIDAAGQFALSRSTLPDGTEPGNLDLAAKTAKWKLTLAEIQSRSLGGELIEAQSMAATMIAELEALPADQADAKLLEAARSELGHASYYTGWAMRLEGAPEAEWRLETDNARAQFRLLAEQSSGTASDDYKKNLEAVIRLEQMTDEELANCEQPSNCKNCKNPSAKKRSQKYSKGASQKPADAREKIKTESAANALQRGKGS